MNTIPSRRFVELLQQTLEGIKPDYKDVIAEIGQVAASERRANGHIFDIRDHLKGLVFSMLSNQRPWGPIAKNSDRIDEIFFDFDPEILKNTDPDYFVSNLRQIRCGNRAIKKQMEALRYDIGVFLNIEEKYGSLDNFVISASPEGIAKKLSTPGEYKLKQIGFALASEYLKNVGVSTIKPDKHLRRILSDKRLRFVDHYPSEEEAVEVLNTIANEVPCSPVYLDNLLWIFCAQDYGNVCGATPRCHLCRLSGYCHYRSTSVC